MKHLLALFALVYVLTMSPNSSCAGVLHVDCTGNGDYITIQKGIDAAAEGDTILVAPCLYEENVVVSSKSIKIIGSGSNNTILQSSGSLAVRGQGPSGLDMQSMTIQGHSETADAILLEGGQLVLTDCVVKGRVWSYWGTYGVIISGSSITDFNVFSSFVPSRVTNSTFGKAIFSAPPLDDPHPVQSTNCSYETLGFINTVHFGSKSDSIGALYVSGAIDQYQRFSAVGSIIETCNASCSATLSLTECEIGALTYEWTYFWPDLQIQKCLVKQDLSTIIDSGTLESLSAGRLPQTNGYSIQHNTILGDLVIKCGSQNPSVENVRSNVVVGLSEVICESNLILSHNVFAGGSEIYAPNGTVIWNQEADPQFCNPEGGDYTVHSSSPCVDAAHDGGNVGAFGVGCGSVDVRSTTWGRIKAKYGN